MGYVVFCLGNVDATLILFKDPELLYFFYNPVLL